MGVYADKGLVVILGCAHSGMINILNRLINETGKDKFYAILSGTHLDFLDPEQLEETIVNGLIKSSLRGGPPGRDSQ